MKYGLFFGDSITYGEYDGVFGGWVDILKRYALQKFNEGKKELILYNLGIGGETTEGLLKRLPHEIIARKAADGNIIFLGYGANDLAVKDGAQMVNRKQFKNNIVNAVQDAKQYAEEIYLVSILPFSNRVDGITAASGKSGTNTEVLAYNQILKDIAEEYNIQYIDFHTAFYRIKKLYCRETACIPTKKDMA